MGVKMGKILHLGIIVRNAEESAKIYEEKMGIGPWVIEEPGPFFEDKIVNGGHGLNIRTAMFKGDGYEIELCEPTGEGVYKDWLEKHGPGMHHIKFESDSRCGEILEMAESISGRKPYLDIKWPDGKQLVAYADVQDELGLLLEVEGDRD